MRILEMARAFQARRWHGYLLGLVLTVLAVWARFQIGDALLGSPFLVSLLAVLITVFLGGFGAGVMTALLSGLLCQYFFIPPGDSLALEWPSGWIAMFFYWGSASLVLALVHGLFLAYERQLQSDAALRELNRELECRVAERTAALEAEMKARNTAQGQVRQLQKMDSLGQLTGGIAHDFNNMLAIIIGSLDMAQRRLNGSEHPKLATNLENAAQGAQRASLLTARLLAFSRQQALAPQAVDANRLVSDMSDMLRRTIGEQFRLECVLAGGLWQAFVDPAQLEHCLLNLAVNARDAMPEGGRLTIETANAELDFRYVRQHDDVEEGQYVLICVSDTGHGMPPEVIERAFDPFYTTKGVGKGTGLGLSQVYGFVKQSSGHVKIYSEVDQGTTVKIYLPRYVSQPAALSAVAGTPVTPPPSSRAGEVVLVVEDEAAVRQMTVEALRELGYTVVHAADAQQAWEHLSVQPRIDLLLTDIVMPGTNGRVLADKAVALRPELKVLYTTGYTRNAVVHNGVLDAGVAFLPKPFTIEQLALKVQAVLRGQVVGNG